MSSLKIIKTLCFDLDGTLYLDNNALPTALETVRLLSKKYNIAYVTNTTSASVDFLEKELIDYGFPVKKKSVFNPASVAKSYLIKNKFDSGILLIDNAAECDYEWFNKVPSDHADCKSVIVGTEGYDLNFRDLSDPLNALLNGARLFTLQKNRFYKKNNQFLMDLGPLTAALEYASSKSAEIFGKPSLALFNSVASRYNHGIENLAMIGDDIEFDIFGAMDLGIKSFLIKTGKYDPSFAAKFTKKPDYEINILSELRKIL